MSDDPLTNYNYDEFTPAKVEPWLRFDQSPSVGEIIQDFQLWHLDKTRVWLSALLQKHRFTVIEFGSFT